MDLDLDTFLVTVYCVVDDLYQARCAVHKPRRRGRRPAVSDSEVLTLCLLAQWLPLRSERAALCSARAQLRAYFPRLLSQSAFNRRVRDLSGVLGVLGPLVAEQSRRLLGTSAAYEVLDAVTVPVLRRCRGRRHRLFGHEVAFGRGGSDRDWCYGLRLLAAVAPEGSITGAVVGPASTEERWLADTLFRWRRDCTAPAPTAAELEGVLGSSHKAGGPQQRQGPTGPLWPRLGAGAPAVGPYLGDRGFAGACWQQHWRQAYDAVVLTPGPAEDGVRPARDRWLSGRRQVVETVFAALSERLGLRFARARTFWGLQTRLAAKVAAFNLAVFTNLLLHRPTFSRFNPWI